MFFSVKYPIKIDGKLYIPCVCYNLPHSLELTVDTLVSSGKAVKYKNRVYFQNGAVIEEKKAPKAVKTVKTAEKKASDK